MGKDTERCGECGTPMVKRRPWQRFCSGGCRVRAFWRRRLDREADRRTENAAS